VIKPKHRSAWQGVLAKLLARVIIPAGVILAVTDWAAFRLVSTPVGLAAVTVGALGLLAAVVVFGVQHALKPLTLLLEDARQVQRGNFETVSVQTGDEFEELAHLLNAISAQLRESITHLEKRVIDRTRELAILNTIGVVVNQSLDIDDTLDRILDETQGLLDLEVGEVCLLDETSQELVIRSQRGLSLEFMQRASRRPVAEVLPPPAIATGVPVVEEDALSSPTCPRCISAGEEGLRAMAIFPLRAKDRLLGTLCLATRRGPRRFSRNEQELLRAISDQAAVAIENAQLYAETSRRIDEVETLFAVQQAITSDLNPDAVLQLIADEARRLTMSELAVVFLVQETELEVAVLSGPTPLGVTRGYRLPVADTLTAEAFSQRKPVRVTNAKLDERAHRDLVERLGVQSLMIVPLIAGSGPIGSISVINKMVGVFGFEDERVMTMMASGAVIGLENARLYKQAQKLAAVEERNRLARDLHDSATQSLYGVTMFAEAAARLLRAGQIEPAADHLHQVQKTAREALQEMRLLIFELRPPILETDGLVAAIQTRLEAVESRSGLQVEFLAGNIDHLPDDIEECVYRVAQEALNNALKHAQAGRVTVNLHRFDGRVLLEVSDDGRGFDPEPAAESGGLGLIGMAERAALLKGHFSVDSRPGAGTTVRLEFNLN
jgi:signal transduction histidine kinase